MVLTFTSEQEQLRDVTRKYLLTRSSEERVRSAMDTDRGFDSTVWSEMAQQIGIQSLAIPEEFGGAGYGFGELAVVLEETGRALLCSPLMSTVVLAAHTLMLSEDKDACAQYLPSIADGSLVATVAVVEESGSWDRNQITASASNDGGKWTINGCKPFVLDGATAQLIIVAAKTESGISLFLVDAADAAVSVTATPTLDSTRRQASVDMNDAPAVLLGDDGQGWSVVESLLDVAATALACEQVGGAARVLESTIEYLGVRSQFGRPIGSFQAIKHRCADMLVELESSKSAAYYATLAVTSNASDLPVAASVAKAYCSDAYFHIASESIQMHGGIGFTWEHPAHLYFKRAKGSQILFGTPSHHRDLIADRIGII
ncbi:acyl-CoA dehydrogenase family protein [Rhodococcus erythropolis]|uniref:acyl-CoA dehydrogenase family protein n=1 Tax=Rhodococcus erythropolis TaxID=1833 RepID=UPI0037B54516